MGRVFPAARTPKPLMVHPVYGVFSTAMPTTIVNTTRNRFVIKRPLAEWVPDGLIDCYSGEGSALATVLVPSRRLDVRSQGVPAVGRRECLGASRASSANGRRDYQGVGAAGVLAVPVGPLGSARWTPRRRRFGPSAAPVGPLGSRDPNAAESLAPQRILKMFRNPPSKDGDEWSQQHRRIHLD